MNADILKCGTERQSSYRLLVWLLGMLMLAGCTQDGPYKASVTGSVTLDGQPIPDGEILMIHSSGVYANAELQSDGTFALKCVPGTYQVAISPPLPADPLAPKPTNATVPGVLIPRRFTEIGTSGLTADVKAEANVIDFMLDSKGGKR